MKIESDRLILRPLVMADAAALAKAANHRSISQYNPIIPFPYSITDAKWFIKHTRDKIKAKKGLELAIFSKETGQFVGMMGLHKIDWTNKNGEMGYWLAVDARGQGFATEALNTVIDHVFQRLKLHRLAAKVMHPNLASQALLKRCGFKKEGIQRQAIHLRGKWLDDVLFGLVNEP